MATRPAARPSSGIAAIFEQLMFEQLGHTSCDDSILDDGELEDQMAEIDGLKDRWDVAAQLKEILPATSWTHALSAVHAPPPDGLVSRFRAAVEGEKKKSSTAAGAVSRVWTGLHVGNLDLVQLCIAARADWEEERRPGVQFGRECKVIWVDSLSTRLQQGGPPGAGQLISRLDGMRELAEKAEFERALALCRAAHLPGFGGVHGLGAGREESGGGISGGRSGIGSRSSSRSSGSFGSGSGDGAWHPLHSPKRERSGDNASPFPRCWVLPDHKIAFVRHVRAARLAALAARRPLPT